MIPKDEFYTENDSPTQQQKEAIWNIVRKSILPSPIFVWHNDRRSFLYGMAASVILMFAAVGLSTTIKSAIDHSQPQAIKVDRAYQSAIREFERVAFQSLTNNQAKGNGLVLTRKEQLQLLDKAISDLKQETNTNDLSPLKQARLRELYSLKLKVLQEMVEQGEIEL